MFRTISRTNAKTAAAAAALVVGLVGFLIPAVPPAKAEGPATTPYFGKGDRLPIVTKEIACSLTGWPNYQPNCHFDRRAPSGEIRTVRIIALR